MSIKEIKLREVGNSVVLTISKEFLKENELRPGDTVFLDEEKLHAAIKKITISDEINIATF
ncbi:addiction module antitoxin [Enterococcus faecium]|uniref:addiction module antitoxin n=1 Tax=Enterococcus faecium TaxID=1352 RepID=UPI000CF33F61|nr:addiction module antitoxin [Enterococcus faecium]EGP4808726.1 addiction module antitoxin [Enterococcus faecium]EME3512102.1 addiction module antitoxin [Enterococcus faecium]EME7094328.1 addiction module antitoxin [Enterococcus faecium]EMF0347014.1 addiction module antitoxin [Enterococcus faecium]PQG42716.1 addiction module antitoxin [Enterococcus faecium]